MQTFGDTPPNVGGAFNPDVDYILLNPPPPPPCAWAQSWEQYIMLRHRNVNGHDGYESDDAVYEVQADDEVVYIGEDFEDVEEGKVEEDGVDERATTNHKRKTQTKKAPAK